MRMSDVNVEPNQPFQRLSQSVVSGDAITRKQNKKVDPNVRVLGGGWERNKNSK